jgi:hypothetical protein
VEKSDFENVKEFFLHVVDLVTNQEELESVSRPYECDFINNCSAFEHHKVDVYPKQDPGEYNRPSEWVDFIHSYLGILQD